MTDEQAERAMKILVELWCRENGVEARNIVVEKRNESSVSA